MSHADIYFAWSYFDGLREKHELKSVRSHHLTTDGRSITVPAAIANGSAEVLRQRFLATAESYPLCRYLGQRKDDRAEPYYEPDPAKFTGHRLSAVLWFEFLHI